MTQFFRISDNSFSKIGFPWIQSIVSGLVNPPQCSTCLQAQYNVPSGDLQVQLDPRKGVRWPDVIGCGDYPLFIVTRRVIQAWNNENIVHPSVGGAVHIRPPFPARLKTLPPPEYLWLDGGRMIACQPDYSASGYVDVRFCPACAGLLYNRHATHQRREESKIDTHILAPATWQGANLFTTALSTTAFYSTQPVLDCARKHRFTNFRFTPVDAGNAAWSKGIDYLGKKWPVHHPLRPSEGKTLEQWLDLLRTRKHSWAAHQAIVDLGQEATPAFPALHAMAKDPDRAIQLAAVHVLSAFKQMGIHQGPDETKEKFKRWFNGK